MLIEYPPGSGVTADYTEAERAAVRELVMDAEAGRISTVELKRVLGIWHDAKVHLDATIVTPPENPGSVNEQTILHIPDPDSDFQIPAKARAKLGLD